MASWKISRASQIAAEIEVPGDKSISHRAVILASMANGICVIKGFLPSEDCVCTVEAMRALGIEIERPDETTLIVHGRKGKFTPPEKDIDCGNSGTAMRLLAGVLAAQPFESRLIGDRWLSERPMARIIKPLSEMGAKIDAEGRDGRPPLRIEGRELEPISYESPIASAQVKSAILLAGLFTKGKTTVTEPVQSRNHTERMLSWFLVHPHVNDLSVSVLGPAVPESREFRVPGDISSAAFWLVAAAASPKNHLLITNVGLNRTRTGVLDVLVRMGAKVHEIVENEEGEPYGTIDIRGQNLKGTTIAGKEIPNVIDELPVLAVAGALAGGTTVIADAGELRVKETDRLRGIATNLKLMGVEVEESPDGIVIYGGGKLKGARLSSFGDHRIAMAFAIAGLYAEGETIIDGVECVNTSYPSFYETFQKITSAPQQETPLISLISGGER